MSASENPAAHLPAAAGGHLRWRFAEVELDESQLRLSVKNEPRELEPRPLQALMFLLRHAGEVVTKDELLENLWPGRIVTEASLTVCVAKLRQALGDTEQNLIRTVHGYGYRLAAPVTVETVAAPPPSLASLRLSEGMTLAQRPNWRLQKRLGAGAYGEAWLCQQPKTHEQRVFKFAADSTQLSALKREVTLFRLLNDELGDRTDVLRLLDWNFEAPPYFIELEYCEEGSLAQWAEAQDGIAQVPQAQRLDIFARIADCVAAAHSLGVLHKDLKPSNILMSKDAEGRPQPRIADWGSGWLLDGERLQRAGITRLGFTKMAAHSEAGTPMYQAPEIALGQPATVQGDIYALGVLLYQLAIGNLNKPLAPGWEHDVADELLREDIARAADGDLQRRLADAAELAERVRKLEPRRQERERRQTAEAELRQQQETIRTLQQRRRWTWAIAATFLIGFITSTKLYFDARTANRQAAAISDFLTSDLLSTANPSIAGNAEVKVRDVLNTAAASLPNRFGEDPETLMALQNALGGAYAGLNIRDRAEDLLNPALSYAVDAHGHHSEQAQAVRRSFLELYSAQRDLDAVTKVADEAQAVERDNGHIDSEFSIQLEQTQAALRCWKLGHEECLPAMQQASEHADRVLGADSPEAARIAISYADTLLGSGKKEEAMTIAKQAIERMQRALGSEHPTVLVKSVYLGNILRLSGKADEAIVLLETLVPKIEKIYGVSSPDSWQARRILAASYSKAGRANEAIPILLKIVEERSQQFGAADAEVRLVRSLYAVALHRAGRTPESIREFDALIALHEQLKDTDMEHKAELIRLRDKFRDEATQAQKAG